MAKLLFPDFLDRPESYDAAEMLVERLVSLLLVPLPVVLSVVLLLLQRFAQRTKTSEPEKPLLSKTLLD